MNVEVEAGWWELRVFFWGRIWGDSWRRICCCFVILCGMEMVLGIKWFWCWVGFVLRFYLLGWMFVDEDCFVFLWGEFWGNLWCGVCLLLCGFVFFFFFFRKVSAFDVCWCWLGLYWDVSVYNWLVLFVCLIVYVFWESFQVSIAGFELWSFSSLNLSVWMDSFPWFVVNHVLFVLVCGKFWSTREIRLAYF